MKKILAFVAVAIIFSSLAGCGGDKDTTSAQPVGTSIVTGNVLAYSAGEPVTKLAAVVQGITVSLLGTQLSAITDASGNFRLTDVPPGEYQLIFRLGEIAAEFQLIIEGENQVIDINDVVIGADGTVTVASIVVSPVTAVPDPSSTPQPQVVDTSTLTVAGGTGSGKYAEGEVAVISANPPEAGKMFDKWTGDTGTVADVSESNTTVTVPSANVTVTATYKDVPTYMLTVYSDGRWMTSGSGRYPAGTVISIDTQARWGTGPLDVDYNIFQSWNCSVDLIRNFGSLYANPTTFIMPAYDVTIYPTYAFHSGGDRL